MAFKSVYEIVESFRKISLLNITDVQLTKWIRDTFTEPSDYFSLKHSMYVMRLIREAYRLGTIRRQSINIYRKQKINTVDKNQHLYEILDENNKWICTVHGDLESTRLLNILNQK